MFTCDVASIDLTPLPLLAKVNDSAANTSLPANTHAPKKSLLGIPEWLTQINDDISRALERGVNIRQLVAARACAIDSLLIALFNWFELDKTDLALFATGGYGRGELSLYSDIDILLLSPAEIDSDASGKIDRLVALLWDIGLDPALSVRSVSDALEAALDHTIASAQLEARLLTGNVDLQELPIQIVNKQWSPRAFFDVKIKEARVRYLQHNATEYNLEPNIKTAPAACATFISWVG